MNHAEYSLLDGITASAIKAGATSMLHMRHAVTTERPDTPAMAFGRLVHMAVLEPASLARCAVWEGDKRTKAWKEFQAANEGREILTADQAESLNAISANVRANRQIADLLAGCEYERPAQWDRPASYGTGKCRFDAVRKETVIDVKSCSALSQVNAEKATFRYLYHLQLGWYCEGACAVGLASLPLAWLVYVETQPPFDCAAFPVGPDVLEYGQKEAVRIATEYRACCESGAWPGVQATARQIGLPNYLMPDLEDEDGD